MSPVSRLPAVRLSFVFAFLQAASACAVNPATGAREFSLIGEGREIEMGREADQQIVTSLGLYPDSALQSYVQDLGAALAAVSERPELPWTFRLVDDPTVNAFALPGGFIYITRGILAHFTSEAQLIGVLGHEIGHVTARHSVTQMSRQQLAQLGLGIGMILSEDVRAVGDLAGAGLQLLSLSFSRGDESEADELGVRYMRRIGHDPHELAGVMRMLERTSQLQSGSGRVPEWLSTHPDPANRVEHIEQLIADSGEDFSDAVIGRDPFLGRIEGVVFGTDPREGFFDAGLFHHPDLRFRLRFPEGWETSNTKDAVRAGPEEGDALLQLTLAEGTPAEALADFAAQDGVSVGRRRSSRVNGLPTASAEFLTTTQEREEDLAGLVSFVRHREVTYQLLGLAKVSRWSSYRGLVSDALRSFEEETDPAVLAVQPDRLELVRLTRSLPFSTFVERYPSTVSSDLVAIINQIESDASFPAGTLAKRVPGG